VTREPENTTNATAGEDLCFLSARELAARIRLRELSPVEVVEAFLERIARRNPDINAYVTVCEDSARAAARLAERAVTKGGELGPLHGIPIALKDLGDLKAGVRNTFGSLALRDWVPQESAAHVLALERAGAVVLGKTNCCEFGTNPTTDNMLVGATSTPFSSAMNAGGSSGGSAAAVADGQAAMAIGGDAGGSVRIPAAMCGVVGLKPSFGYIAAPSRPNGFGSDMPYSHIGPIARTVADAALGLSVLAGRNPRDPFSVQVESEPLAAVQANPGDLRIAFSPDLGVFPVEAEVAEIVASAVDALALSGGAIVDVVSDVLKRPLDQLGDAWKLQVGVRAAQIVAIYKERGLDLLGESGEALTPEFLYFVELGRSASALEYRMLDMLQTEVLDALEDVLASYDLIATPTISVAGVRNGTGRGLTRGPSSVSNVAVDPAIGWCLTFPANLTGHPAVSLPAGRSDCGLPVGLQLIGRRYDDDRILAASAVFERVRPWRHWYPALAADC
jgi:amidase/aspartyl-tRNA(Asn)/glutamyl-tRNA(Gln) amidotransferase subunit A